MEEKISKMDYLIFALSACCLGSGIYHGFQKAHGININLDTFKGSTIYGPSLLLAGFNSIKFQIRGEREKTMAASLAGIVQGTILTAAGYGLGYLIGSAVKS